LTILLHRDDGCCDNPYDFLLISFQSLDSHFDRKSEGDFSASLSVCKVFAFDLGWNERNAKSANSSKESLTLLAGYSPPEKVKSEVTQSDWFDSQIVLKLDKSESGTRVALVLSCLGFVFMAGPLRDGVGFLAREWSEHGNPMSNSLTTTTFTSLKANDDEAGITVPYLGNTVELQLVLHYPQIAFTADEHDLYSRSLLLRW
jgi:hypothetical protein